MTAAAELVAVGSVRSARPARRWVRVCGWARPRRARLIAGSVLVAVAVATGTVSYKHIYRLSVVLHQAPVAWLMPVGVDGLIVVGSIVLLNSATKSKLGWLGIGPGVAISLFANVESGIGYGWLAALWAGVPAATFALSTFIFERWLAGLAPVVSKAPARLPDPAAGPVPPDVPAGDTAEADVPGPDVPDGLGPDVPDVEPVVSLSDGTGDRDTTGGPGGTADGTAPLQGAALRAAVHHLKTLHGDWSQQQIADELGVSRKSVNRHLNGVPVNGTSLAGSPS